MLFERLTLNASEILRVVAGVLFAVFGAWIMTGDVINPNIDRTYQDVMGFVMILYGIFRIVQVRYRQRAQQRRLWQEAEMSDES